MQPRAWAVVSLTLALVGCGASPIRAASPVRPIAVSRHGDTRSMGGPAQWGPQLEGTISQIVPGPHTRVVLKNAQEAVKTDGRFHHYATLVLSIGPGSWTAPNHWRAKHDSMDLFVGEPVAAVPGHVADTIAGQPNNFQGIVRRIHGDRVTLQRVKILGTTRTGNTARLLGTETVFYMAPYSRFSWKGNGAMPAGNLRVGQYIDGLWEGWPSYPIIDQWTVFPDAKAFLGTSIEAPHYAHLTTQSPRWN